MHFDLKMENVTLYGNELVVIFYKKHPFDHILRVFKHCLYALYPLYRQIAIGHKIDDSEH